MVVSSASYETTSPEETEELGARLSEDLEPGSVVLLAGDLGSGKTCFTKGIARGLGNTGYVKSPSFTIISIYESGRMPLYHVDLYRLEGVSDLDTLGLEEYIYGKGVTVIEWAEKARELVPENDAITVEFILLDENSRRIVIKN